MAETIFIKGKLNYFGGFNEKTQSKFDKENKVRFSLKDYTVVGDDTVKKIKDAFKDSADAFIPKWVKSLGTKEQEQYINFKSYYEIPVMDLQGSKVENEDVLPNSEVTLKCTIKDGAIYPSAMRVDKKGESYNPFAGL